ncbi:MAG: hypothetical protein VB934_20985, partial [Polyangiaceae bacterium]
ALASLALAGTRTTLSGRGLPGLPMVRALQQLGVAVEHNLEQGEYEVVGVGLDGWSVPEAIDCGPSMVTLLTLSSLLSGMNCTTTLHSEAPRAPRVMAAVAQTLRRRGAQLEGSLRADQPRALYSPYTIATTGDGAPLSPLDIELVGGSDTEIHHAMKSAALLSGLFSDGPTRIHEAPVSDARLERLLAAAGLALEASGPFTVMADSKPPGTPSLGDAMLSGDSGLGWTLLAAAFGVPGSDVTVRTVNIDPTQSGTTEALRDAGCHIALRIRAEQLGQTTADIRIASGGPGRALAMVGERAGRSSTSLPCLAAIASNCPSAAASLLSVPTSHAPQTAKTISVLDRFGIASRSVEEGLSVDGAGGAALQAADIDAEGDADIAMMATSLALRASGPCTIHGVTGITAVYPRFVATLRALGARIEVHEALSP